MFVVARQLQMRSCPERYKGRIRGEKRVFYFGRQTPAFAQKRPA